MEKVQTTPYVQYVLDPEHASHNNEELAKKLDLVIRQGEAPGSMFAFIYQKAEEGLCFACGKQMIGIRENGSNVLNILDSTSDSVKKRISKIATVQT